MSQKNLISFDEIAENDPNFLDTDEYTHWASQFDNDHPLNLEIGFGNGSFLIEMAIQNPDINFIGMDFYHKGIRKTITRIGKLQLKNVRLAYGDARKRIPFLFREQDLQAIYINFPDPWPKKRHIKRRLIKPPFVNVLAEKLKASGKIFIATDSESYALEILDVFESELLLANAAVPSSFIPYRNGAPQSKYEKSFIKQDKKIFYMEFVKK